MAALKKGKTAEEQQRLSDAACALVRCAEGVPDSDPNKAALNAAQQRGSTYLAEQQLLKQGGGFTYTKKDATNDWLLLHDEGVYRTAGTVQGVGGAMGTVSAGAGVAVTAPACTTIVGCVVPVGLTGLAALSLKEADEGFGKALGGYPQNIGNQVFASFDPKTYPGESNGLAGLGVDAAVLGLQIFIAKMGGRLLTVDPKLPKTSLPRNGAGRTETPDHLLPENIQGDGLIPHPVKKTPSQVLAGYGNIDVKLQHTFDKPAHKLDAIATRYGGQKEVFAAIHEAAQKFQGRPGLVEGWIPVGGSPVWVRGTTVNGEFRIGTFSANIHDTKYPYKGYTP